MEFSAYAAKETAALIARIFAESSQASLQRLEGLRSALDAATLALESALAEPPDSDREVAELVNLLSTAAADEADARLKRLSSEARKVTDSLRAELEEQTASKDALAVELEQVQSDAAAVRAELRDLQREAQADREQLADVQAAHAQIEAARKEAIAARDKEAGARASLESELKDVRAQLKAARAEASGAKTQLQATAAERVKLEDALSAANTLAEAADAKVAAVTTLLKASAARVQALEREQEEHASALLDLEARLQAADAGAAAPANALSLLDGMVGAFEALSSAATIGDVLATLVEQLVAELPRVALFRVKGNRLEGTHQIGFDLANDIGKVVLPLAMDSLLTRAVSSGRTERISGEDLADTSGLPFGGSPAFALAMPIVVDGESIAVVYADDSGQTPAERPAADPDLSARFAEALRHHTVALLMRLRTELKAMAELRAYATALVEELEQMYTADEAAERPEDELRKRLRANLDYARSIYANRASFESPAAAELFEAQIAAMIDAHRDAAFGRDLEMVAGSGGAARAAEAS